jgi:hypothetical protein
MEAVYAWSQGVKFVEVQKLTKAFEGTTIHTLRRLKELVRQITTAAKAIENRESEEKSAKGGEIIRRDIVFCSSLYLWLAAAAAAGGVLIQSAKAPCSPNFDSIVGAINHLIIDIKSPFSSVSV